MPINTWTASTPRGIDGALTATAGPMEIRLLRSIAEIEPRQWNALDLQGNPFVRHEFLHALEEERCVHAHTGWTPAHLTLSEQGVLRGAMPLYLKTHSWGEFVFDWAWADAYQRAGLEYYPKLVCTVPFTPAFGPRLLTAPGHDTAQLKTQLAAALVELQRGEALSSAHVLFQDDDDATALAEQGFLLRHSCQFHWYNAGYASFDDFVAALRADKRKKLLRERRRVQEQGIRFETLHGGDIDRALWDTLFGFSATTFERHGHEHYLTAAFFHRVSQSLPDHVMVKMAVAGGTPVAAAIFFRGRDALYGRYWGSSEAYHSLHFETCYHQGIEYCIANNLARFEPGTQGEHKIPRGFAPTLVSSAHYIAEPRFRRAVAEHVRLETAAVKQYAEEMRQHLPFRRETDTLSPEAQS